MTIEKNALSSDLDRARLVSRRLRGAETVEAKPKKPAPQYAQFSLNYVAGGTGADGNAARRWGSEIWNELLDRSMGLSGATAAFLADERGLVLTARGPVATDRVEVLGARLVVAVEQATKLVDDPRPASTIAVEIGESWVTGIQVESPDGTSLLMGLIANEPISGVPREQIIRLVMRAIRP